MAFGAGRLGKQQTPTRLDELWWLEGQLSISDQVTRREWPAREISDRHWHAHVEETGAGEPGGVSGGH